LSMVYLWKRRCFPYKSSLITHILTIILNGDSLIEFMQVLQSLGVGSTLIEEVSF
jgi:hypothetical protein